MNLNGQDFAEGLLRSKKVLVYPIVDSIALDQQDFAIALFRADFVLFSIIQVDEIEDSRVVRSAISIEPLLFQFDQAFPPRRIFHLRRD